MVSFGNEKTIRKNSVEVSAHFCSDKTYSAKNVSMLRFLYRAETVFGLFMGDDCINSTVVPHFCAVSARWSITVFVCRGGELPVSQTL